MRIVLDRTLFDAQSEAEAMALADLFTSAARNADRHALLTDPLYEPGRDNGEIDDWLSARPPSEANAFRAPLENGPLVDARSRSMPVSGRPLSPDVAPAQPRPWNLAGPLVIRVDRRAHSDWQSRRLTLPDAADLLREPVHLVLENARTDLAFLAHLAGPTDGATLRALLSRPGSIERHGGGGGEVKMWLEQLTRGAPTPEKWRRMLRAWVLFDQDAGEPDARTPSAGAVDLMEACEAVVNEFGPGLSWICLRRREIESYVPDGGLLAQRADTNTFAQQVVDWRKDPNLETWAWALDLKKGLHGDRHAKWRVGMTEEDADAVNKGQQPLMSHMLKAPFSGLSPQDIARLARGFGKHALADGLLADVSPGWTSDIPAEYDRGPADQAPRPELVQSLFDRM